MTFDHPEGSNTKARGNVELLPTGNIWICSARGSMQSEQRPDVSLIMKANFLAPLGSYRDSKFPWIRTLTRVGPSNV